MACETGTLLIRVTWKIIQCFTAVTTLKSDLAVTYLASKSGVRTDKNLLHMLDSQQTIKIGMWYVIMKGSRPLNSSTLDMDCLF